MRTRDLGHVDDKGYLYLVGRTRDVILVNAMVVYAGPIERVLASHPDVIEAYVTGAPDERTGEAVHAFVVPPAAPSTAATSARWPRWSVPSSARTASLRRSRRCPASRSPPAANPTSARCCASSPPSEPCGTS